MMPKPLEAAMYGMLSTYALRLADKHGVFVFLAERGATLPAQIAADLGLDAETLERLLLVLSAFGLLERSVEGACSVPAALVPYLNPRDGQYIGAPLEHLADNTWGRLHRLDAYLTRGKATADAELPAPFETLYQSEELVRNFLAAMWQLSYDVSKELVRLANLEQSRHLVDVGGASGPFATAALLAVPGLQATIFDLPPVAPHAAATAERYGLQGRLHFAAGDFFRDSLPRGDCFAFGYVFSNWPDEVCLELLGKAREACAPGGRVLVMDRLFETGKQGPLPTAAMNLVMHVETRGRHRTADEYVDLLARAGFVAAEARRTTREKHLIVGYKAGA